MLRSQEITAKWKTHSQEQFCFSSFAVFSEMLLGDPGKTEIDDFRLGVANPVVPVHGTEHINGLWLSAGSM